MRAGVSALCRFALANRPLTVVVERLCREDDVGAMLTHVVNSLHACTLHAALKAARQNLRAPDQRGAQHHVGGNLLHSTVVRETWSGLLNTKAIDCGIGFALPLSARLNMQQRVVDTQATLQPRV